MGFSVYPAYIKLIGGASAEGLRGLGPLILGGDIIYRTDPQKPGNAVCRGLNGFGAVNVMRKGLGLRLSTESATESPSIAHLMRLARGLCLQ